MAGVLMRRSVASKNQLRLAATGLFGVIVALSLGACTSSQKKEQENIRSSVRTAPADLQLTCSTETVTRLQITGEQLLPISSSEISPNIFRVDFNTQGGPAYCIIDQSGTVLSVERVAAGATAPTTPPAT